MESTKTINPQAPADYDRAIDKIRDEMAQSKSCYVSAVGEFLTEYLRGHRSAAGAILAAGKSIKGSLEAMSGEAKRHKEGNMAVLDGKTAFGIVLRYYGISGQPDEPEPQAGERDQEDDLSLDALLGLL